MTELENKPEETTETPVSPDQMDLFEQTGPATMRSAEAAPATTLNISHKTAETADQVAVQTETAPAAETTVAEEAAAVVAEETEPSEDKIPKTKIIAALVIVGIAGYVAYWVQEPLQLKSDLLSSTPVNSETNQTTPTAGVASLDSTETATNTDTSTVAEKSTDTSSTTPETVAQSTGPSVNVDVSLFGFEPATVKIDKGATVVWTNTSTEDQTIIGSSTNGQSFASPVLTSGQSFSYLFDQDGTFEYYSTYNPALKASITVGTGSPTLTTPAETGTDTPETAAGETTENVLTSAIDETMTAQNNEPITSLEPAETQETTVTEELKPAADAPKKLAKTGPAETLYLGIILVLAWANRKKLQKAFKSY